MPKFNKDVLLKVGIAAAVALIVYLVYRSRKCKDGYADYVPTPADDEYAENMFEDQPADYAEEAEAEPEPEAAGTEAYTLMQSTLDDGEANAMFEPEA